MSVTQASKKSYTQLKAEGSLSRLERAVCDVMGIKKFTATTDPRPIYGTRREVAEKLNEQASTISGTVNGLIHKGAIVEGGKVDCKITGRQVRSILLVKE